MKKGFDKTKKMNEKLLEEALESLKDLHCELRRIEHMVEAYLKEVV